MKRTPQDRQDKQARMDQPDTEGRGSQRMTGHRNSPGGGGSQERIPAKGNDLTHEEDLLGTDIRQELDGGMEDEDR